MAKGKINDPNTGPNAEPDAGLNTSPDTVTGMSLAGLTPAANSGPEREPDPTATRIISAGGGSRASLKERKLGFKFPKGRRVVLPDGTIRYEY